MSKGLLKRIFVLLAGGLFNVAYRMCCCFPRRDEVLFVSRKSKTPSYDYLECAKAFERYGYAAVFLSGHLKKGETFAYIKLVFRQIYHLARCRVCVIDRYDPVISLLSLRSVREDASNSYNNEIPVEPVVIQLWHAFGAFKKFGYQCLDMPEGHTREEAELFKIHRNNSWVICSGEGARAAFLEAFSCPVDRVIPLGRPEYRRLLELGSSNDEACGKTDKYRVLFAPTIRKYDNNTDPFAVLKQAMPECLDESAFELLWSDHPLASGNDVVESSFGRLLDADLVITDYSSIVYEAYLLKKPVLFFEPDIKHYRYTPGLNVDPTEKCPDLVFFDCESLSKVVEGLKDGSRKYEFNQLGNFVGAAFDGAPVDPAEALADFICEGLAKGAL